MGGHYADGRDDGRALSISDLIKALLDQGESYRSLESRSARAGFRVKFQTFQELATHGPKSWPKSADTIRGLAAALEVTQQAVVLGFAASLGLDVKASSALAQQLPAGAQQLSEGMRAAIVALVRAATREAGGGGAMGAGGLDETGVPVFLTEAAPGGARRPMAARRKPKGGTAKERIERQLDAYQEAGDEIPPDD